MRYVARLRDARQWNSSSSTWPAKKVVECPQVRWPVTPAGSIRSDRGGGVEWRHLVSGAVLDQASALIRFRSQAPGVRVRYHQFWKCIRNINRGRVAAKG
jgi:hypothetical protein